MSASDFTGTIPTPISNPTVRLRVRVRAPGGDLPSSERRVPSIAILRPGGPNLAWSERVAAMCGAGWIRNVEKIIA